MARPGRMADRAGALTMYQNLGRNKAFSSALGIAAATEKRFLL
jgi:hypothetical protein